MTIVNCEVEGADGHADVHVVRVQHNAFLCAPSHKLEAAGAGVLDVLCYDCANPGTQVALQGC